MSSSPPEPTAVRVGLRERKKARTRQRIQDEAMRLFADHGYEATTVEQIAEAAEVSPSTFFRYYPSKEDVVVQDRFDPDFLATFTDLSDDRPALEIVRDSIRTAVASISPTEMAQAKERSRLVLSVAALRSRSIEYNMEILGILCGNLARKLGREPDDPDILAFSGAIAGAMVAVMFSWAEREDVEADDLSGLLDRMFDQLAAGLVL